MNRAQAHVPEPQWGAVVGDAGLEPEKVDSPCVTTGGREAPPDDRSPAQAGQEQGVTSGTPVEQRTEADAAQPDVGRLESTTRAQPEHNQSATESALPPDLAAVLSAWPNLPEDVKAGIAALVQAAGSTGSS